MAELPGQEHDTLKEIMTASRDTPNRLGNWVMAMVNPAPILKPTRMLSLINLTSTLRRNNQARKHRPATANAVRLAIST